jgi:hypothetical protein
MTVIGTSCGKGPPVYELFAATIKLPSFTVSINAVPLYVIKVVDCFRRTGPCFERGSALIWS